MSSFLLCNPLLVQGPYPSSPWASALADGSMSFIVTVLFCFRDSASSSYSFISSQDFVPLTMILVDPRVYCSTWYAHHLYASHRKKQQMKGFVRLMSYGDFMRYPFYISLQESIQEVSTFVLNLHFSKLNYHYEV